MEEQKLLIAQKGRSEAEVRVGRTEGPEHQGAKLECAAIAAGKTKSAAGGKDSGQVRTLLHLQSSGGKE